jgi:hypothetical protein
MLGEAANVSIADPDANENAAVVDSIRVFTSSSSAIDQAGRDCLQMKQEMIRAHSESLFA